MRTDLAASHRAPLAELLARTGEFTREEVEVALELIDAGLAGSRDYRFFVDVDDHEAARVRGYICFGPTPMTVGAYDLYWIAVDPSLKRAGVGRALVAEMERAITAAGGYLVRVETAGLDAYEPTRSFYERIGYETLARIRDFYARGNDLVIYGRYL